MDIVELHHATLDKVDEAPRGSNNHLHAFAQGAYLAFDARTAIDGEHLHVGEIFRKIGNVGCDLQTEFAGGGEDKSLRSVVFRVDTLEHGESESGSLSRAGLGERHHVALFVEQVGDYPFLHGHGVLESQLFDGSAQGCADA